MSTQNPVETFGLDHALALTFRVDVLPFDVTRELGGNLFEERILLTAEVEPPTLSLTRVAFSRKQPDLLVQKTTVGLDRGGTKLLGTIASWASRSVEGAVMPGSDVPDPKRNRHLITEDGAVESQAARISRAIATILRT